MWCDRLSVGVRENALLVRDTDGVKPVRMPSRRALVVLRFVIGVLIGGIAVAGFFSTLDSSSDVPAAATPSSTTLAGATTTHSLNQAPSDSRRTVSVGILGRFIGV